MQSTIACSYFEMLDSLVRAINQQAAALPAPTRDIAEQRLANVTAAIEAVANAPEFQQLPPLTTENGELTAIITSPAQATAEALFRTQVFGRLFAGLMPLASILTQAMQKAYLWDNAWLTAYHSASGHSINLGSFQGPTTLGQDIDPSQ